MARFQMMYTNSRPGLDPVIEADFFKRLNDDEDPECEPEDAVTRARKSVAAKRAAAQRG